MFVGRLNNFENHAIDPLQAKFHLYARSRPSSTWGIIQQNNHARCKCSQSAELDYATLNNSPTKKASFNPICCRIREPSDRMPKPNTDAMPAQAFMNIVKRVVASSSRN